MAFQKKTWKDRLVEFAGRRTLTKVSENDTSMVVDVSRNEGAVSQVGDAFSAANMNDLEQRIEEAFEDVTSITKGVLSAGATSITINDSRITADSALSFYSGIFGVNPTAVTVANGSVTLTFKAQKSDMEVGVRVNG